MTANDPDTSLRDTAARAARDIADEVAGTAREAGRETYEAARDRLGSAAQAARDLARAEAAARASAGKSRLADDGARLAEGLHEAAGSQAPDSLQARILETLADGLAEVSEDLRQRSIGSILTGTEDMARCHPGAFVAGAALLGFAAIRFARSSAAGPGGDRA